MNIAEKLRCNNKEWFSSSGIPITKIYIRRKKSHIDTQLMAHSEEMFNTLFKIRNSKDVKELIENLEQSEKLLEEISGKTWEELKGIEDEK